MQFNLEKAGLGAAYGTMLGLFVGLIVSVGIGASGITTVATFPSAIVFPLIMFSAIMIGIFENGGIKSE